MQNQTVHQNVSQPRTGLLESERPFLPETQEKVNEAKKGRKISEEGRRRMSEAQKRRFHPEGDVKQ